MEHETQMIVNLKNTELLKLKEEISSLQQTKLVTANTDVTFHKIPNTDPVKSKKRASQSTQVTEMQKLDDESKDCKNENHDTDQQVQKGGMSEDPHESLNTLNYIGKLTRKDTTEMDGVDSPSKKPDHDIVKTKRCYRCRDDRHLIRDCTVGPKTWARSSRMQPCHICKKTGHNATSCWFRNQKPGEKRCFRCGSSKHIVKNCTLPRPTNASLGVEENHACSAQGDGMHMYGRYDWYRTHEERIRILVTDIIHESCSVMVCLFRKDLHEELLKAKMPKPKKEIEVSRSDDARESVTDNPRTDSKPETILVLHNDDTSVKTSLDSPMSLPSGPTDPWLLFEYRLLVVRSSSFHSTCHLQQHPDPLAIFDLCLHSQLILKPRHVILVIFDHHLSSCPSEQVLQQRMQSGYLGLSIANTYFVATGLC